MSDVFLFDPTQLFLEFDATTANKAWLQSQKVNIPTNRWQTYLNRLCEIVFIAWLKEEIEQPIQANPDLTNCSELVNGTAITMGDKRLLIVPTEATDLSEIRVPQEWVDIASWVADYYFGVEVNLDDCYIRIYGYTTHQKLKNKGTYNSADRSYFLTDDDLIKDINAFLLARELCPTEITQAQIESIIASISTTQAENLIQRLGSPQILLPRLSIPFTFWAALIENETWRKKLIRRRRGLPERGSILQWLQTGITNMAEEIGWRKVSFKPSMVGARGISSACKDETILTTKPAFAKQITITDTPYELKILPLDVKEGIWGFELRSLVIGGMIPPGFKLKLLTENLESFEGNADIAVTAVEKLYLEVALELGEGLVWVVEPTPDEYEPEILRF